MRLHPVVDQFAMRLEAAGIMLGAIDGAPWIDALEREFGRRLPASFAGLVRRYAFRPFEWGPLLFFGNSEAADPFNLHVAATSDPAISRATRQAGLIQIGRPATGHYDPICLDLRASDREPSIVRLDHEAILIKEQVKVTTQIAPSLGTLVESLIAGGRAPALFEP